MGLGVGGRRVQAACKSQAGSTAGHQTATKALNARDTVLNTWPNEVTMLLQGIHNTVLLLHDNNSPLDEGKQFTHSYFLA